MLNAFFLQTAKNQLILLWTNHLEERKDEFPDQKLNICVTFQ